VPSRSGAPICLYFEEAPQSSHWEVYNAAGERVASLNFGPERDQCWEHLGVAPGIYFILGRVLGASGEKELKQKIAIIK
jgi:hypothetical protein